MKSDGHFERFATTHDNLFDNVHGHSAFFPFHRRFILEFENIGRRIDPTFTVPYWDTTRDYRNPDSSPVLSSTAIGGNGMGSDGCVLNGIQSNWTMSFPNRHCLQRQYSDGDSIGPWVPAEVISSYIQSDRQLADFREHIEFGYHGAVHLGLGGDAATKHAPNDFFFHMHHANIDRLWWLWQNGQNAFFNYNGPGDRGEAQLDDTIPEDRTVNFGRAPVGSVMILGYNGMCYSYDSAPAPPARYPWPPNGDGGDDTRLAMTARNTSTSVLSGSSVMAGHALELVRIHGALKGQGELSEYFPKVASLAPSRVEMLSQTATGKKNCTCKQYVNRAIMYPPRMTEPWIRMHGFDPERVEQVHRDACRLVDLLNDSNYVSPY